MAHLRSRTIPILVGLSLALLTLIGWEVHAAVAKHHTPPPAATHAMIP